MSGCRQLMNAGECSCSEGSLEVSFTLYPYVKVGSVEHACLLEKFINHTQFWEGMSN